MPASDVTRSRLILTAAPNPISLAVSDTSPCTGDGNVVEFSVVYKHNLDNGGLNNKKNQKPKPREIVEIENLCSMLSEIEELAGK